MNDQPANTHGCPVTFRFSNIGPVKDASLELGRLTVIAGRNNTGKTYLTYSLYGFLKAWRLMEMDVKFPPHHKSVQRVMDGIAGRLAEGGAAAMPLSVSAIADHRRSVAKDLGDPTDQVAFAGHRLYDDVKDLIGGYYDTANEYSWFVSETHGKGSSIDVPLYMASASARGLSARRGPGSATRSGVRDRGRRPHRVRNRSVWSRDAGFRRSHRPDQPRIHRALVSRGGGCVMVATSFPDQVWRIN